MARAVAAIIGALIGTIGNLTRISVPIISTLSPNISTRIASISALSRGRAQHAVVARDRWRSRLDACTCAGTALLHAHPAADAPGYMQTRPVSSRASVCRCMAAGTETTDKGISRNEEGSARAFYGRTSRCRSGRGVRTARERTHQVPPGRGQGGLPASSRRHQTGPREAHRRSTHRCWLTRDVAGVSAVRCVTGRRGEVPLCRRRRRRRRRRHSCLCTSRVSTCAAE